MYTIKPYDCGVKLATIVKRIEARAAKDGRFRPRLTIEDGEIHVKVRLQKAKPYCGQHPGECQAGPFGFERPKRSGSWLEWDDWVAFNDLVNDVLDGLRACAEVWSVPPEIMDKGKKFHIRRGRQRRVRWDWTEEHRGGLGRPVRVWNHGSPDQFEETEAEKLARNLSRGKTIKVPKEMLRDVAHALKH